MPTAEDVRTEVKSWLEENWDPDLTVAEWWDRLARSGYAAPTFPEDAWGKGWGRDLAMVVNSAIAEHGAIGPPAGLGVLLAGPTIAAHGNERQKQEDLLRILNGQDAWCQLFSEPGAGSDLAGLQTKAIKDGDEWIVTGQKVWTSTAQLCNLGMLIARTDPDLPKHKGITYFKFDMTQPGVEVRPLREMTGRAMFNEVFIDNARVSDDDIIGGLNNGWAVTNTTLMAERGRARNRRLRRGRLRVRGSDRGPARQPRGRPRRSGPHRRHGRRWPFGRAGAREVGQGAGQGTTTR